MKRQVSILIMFVSFALACQKKNPIKEIQLEELNGNTIQAATLFNNFCTVLIFFSPECPLSENYTLNMNTLSDKYSNDSIKFIAFIPGSDFSLEKIKEFRLKYNLKAPLYLDKKKELVNYLNASITPECFVLNRTDKIIYHGAIDNWAIDLGKKRTIITEYYLQDAISAIINNSPVKNSYVEAIGCYIE